MSNHTKGFSRRSLFQGIASAAALGTLGTVGAISQQAKAASTDRKFLFFFAGGGWDPTPLDPKYAPDGASPLDTADGATDMDPDTALGEAGNLSWSSGADREAMDRFFLRWGGRTALMRGVNVHSAGHEAGMKWMMTGTSASSTPDWPTILAANGVAEYPMPHLVFSGPSYPGNFGAAVVRGGGGTLLDLIDGSINGRADKTSPVFTPPQDSMMDAFVFDRAAKYASRTRGLGEVRAEDLLSNLERGMELEGRRFEAGLDDTGRSMLDQALMAVEVMRLGLSRCSMVGIRGGWDTHGGNQNVGTQMDSFFAMLDELVAHLATTPGTSAPWLLDEVTIVCTSELGRTPRFNGAMGRDHWPYTSMMAIGSGVKGNRVVGKTSDGFIAEPCDFATGLPSTSGDIIGTEHVGTALLKLGGVDHDRFLQGVQPLDALLREG
ncbi:MAG: DUF1501 domain-containing protein [Proteobacteria bacterium]|nr:DUF1501 domain-containing protein [Pseudomonadota bacterium]